MSRILVGKEAADYLRNKLTQHVQETGKGVRITIDRKIRTKQLEVQAVVALVDSLIADDVPAFGEDISEMTANLYSARLHLMRAIKEVA